MAVNQVQIRRDSRTNLFAATPTDGELAYDTTNKRLSVGDGSGVYGTPVASIVDSQNQRFNAIADTSGSANTITLTFATELAPAAYAAYQRFVFIAANTNTATTNINVSSLGNKIIKKNVGGALSILAAGDITTGLLYEVMYDGTDFILSTAASHAASITGNYIEATVPRVAGATNNYTTTWAKEIEMIIGRAGVYNVRIVSDNGANGTHYLKTYLNDIAEGTQLTAFSGGTYTLAEDITCERGDTIQLYARAVSGTVNIDQPAFTVCSGNPYNASTNFADDRETN